MLIKMKRLMRVFLVLFLIVAMSIPTFALTGTYTDHKYFYKPGFESYGGDEFNAYEDALDRADAQMPIFPQAYATGTGTVGDPWMDDCINKAITAASAGDTVFCRAGYYSTESGKTIATIQKTINLIGEGINKTFFITAADMHGIYIGDSSTSYVTLEGFTLDGDAQTSDSYWGIEIAGEGIGHNYLTIRNVEVKNTHYYGINCPDVRYSLFENLWLHDNDRHGLHPANDAGAFGTYNTYRNLYLYDNGVSGVSDPGANVDTIHLIPSHNIWDNVHAWGNGAEGITICSQSDFSVTNCTAYDNTGAGFLFTEVTNLKLDNCSAMANGSQGIKIGHSLLRCRNINMSNCTSALNDTYGIHIWYVDGLNISNIMSYSNNWSGICFDDSSDINLVNVEANNNNCNDGALSGIQIIDTTNIKMTSCRATDNRTLTSTYISFVDGDGGADTILTTKDAFLLAGFLAGEDITITGDSDNNGVYTIVSVTKDTITLATGSLPAAPEAVGDAVTIVQEKMQDYGLLTSGTVNTIDIVNCSLTGNLTGNISNGATAVITFNGVVDGDAAVTGDIAYHNGTNWVRLAKGTAGQVLEMNSGETAPEWDTDDLGLANLVEDLTPELGANLDAKDKNITGLGSVSFTQELDNGSKTGNFSVDFSTDQNQKVTLTVNTITLTLDTTSVGVGHYSLKVINGGLATLTWASESGSVYWPGGTEPTLTASGTDEVALKYDGTNWSCVASLDFK